jgi:hypothetical protein
MPLSKFAWSARTLIAALMVTIAGVLVLDATAIVAAPTSSTRPGAQSASAPSHTNPQLRLLSWSHQLWLVFPSNGPDGPKSLSDSTKAVYVDARGRLHMTATKVGGVWRGVQLESLNSINYGTYRFVTDSQIGHYAKPLVLGMFVYKPSAVPYTNEIDLENSPWLLNMHYPRDAQFVVQPYTVKKNIHRYAIRNRYATTTQQFIWRPHRVDFLTRAGASASGKVLSRFHYSGPAVPTPSNEHVYINFHVHSGKRLRRLGHGSHTVIMNSYSNTAAR